MKFKLLVLLIFVLTPCLAQASIFDQLIIKPRSCSSSSAVSLSCSEDYRDGLFSSVSCKVMKAFHRGVVPLYCSTVQSSDYQSALKAFMALFVVIWGISFLIGAIPMTFGGAMVNLLKLVFVYAFAANVDMFFDFLYPAVVGAPAELLGVILGSTNSENAFYVYVDQHLSLVLNSFFLPEVSKENGEVTRALDLRLFVLGAAVGKLVPGGSFVTGLFFMVVVGWLFTYLNIMVRYIVSLMGLILLLMLTPIFLPSILFPKLRFLADEWIKMILSFSFQIVIVVTFLIMVESFFVDFMDLIKLGFNNIVLEKDYHEFLMSQGSTTVGNAVDAVYKEYGITVATAEKYVTQLQYNGDKSEFVPWFVLKLLTAMVMMYLTYQWMEQVPSFAGLLSGNPKFPQVAKTYGQGHLGMKDVSTSLIPDEVAAKISGKGQRPENVGIFGKNLPTES